MHAGESKASEIKPEAKALSHEISRGKRAEGNLESRDFASSKDLREMALSLRFSPCLVNILFNEL